MGDERPLPGNGLGIACPFDEARRQDKAADLLRKFIDGLPEPAKKPRKPRAAAKARA